MNVIVFRSLPSERVGIIVPSYNDGDRPQGDTDAQLIAREVESMYLPMRVARRFPTTYWTTRSFRKTEPSAMRGSALAAIW